MSRVKNINWYLDEPTRLTLMKPFTRGGSMKGHGWELTPILNNSVMSTGFCNL